ncbi:hypothetical protein AcW2_004759 [Taiwanofungus camphoratus]|nr:hypothetical protein AcW2_004759 [Antrodia cinnamomea]
MSLLLAPPMPGSGVKQKTIRPKGNRWPSKYREPPAETLSWFLVLCLAQPHLPEVEHGMTSPVQCRSVRPLQWTPMQLICHGSVVLDIRTTA